MNEQIQVPYLNIDYFFYKIYQAIELLFKLPEFKFTGLKSFSFILVIFFSIGIILLIFKISLLKKKRISSVADFSKKEGIPAARLSRWDEIKGRLASDNPSDWKSAVIEADSLVDEIMAKIGYVGETLGEKLKIIEPSDFDNLKNVWEAHRIRKKIEHKFEGIAFEITKEEAKNALEKYEKALKELRYI